MQIVNYYWCLQLYLIHATKRIKKVRCLFIDKTVSIYSKIIFKPKALKTSLWGRFGGAIKK